MQLAAWSMWLRLWGKLYWCWYLPSDQLQWTSMCCTVNPRYMWLSKHITRCWLQATSSAFRLHLISRKIWMKRDYRLLRAIQSFSDRLPTSDRNPFSRAAGSSLIWLAGQGLLRQPWKIGCAGWTRRPSCVGAGSGVFVYLVVLYLYAHELIQHIHAKVQHPEAAHSIIIGSVTKSQIHCYTCM